MYNDTDNIEPDQGLSTVRLDGPAVKATRAQFGHTNKGIPKYLHNCMIKHKLLVPCDSCEENCAQTRTFSIHHLL